MGITTKLAPPNSIVLVSDVGGGEIPDPESMVENIVATNSCVAVGCRAEDDGETEFTLAPLSEVDRGQDPAYEGVLKTPKRLVVICTVLGQQVLALPVGHELTRVKVWTNHPNEPDVVVIGVG